MKVLIHCDEYYPTAQACAYRMQVFADAFLSLGDEVCVITSSANKLYGTFDKNARKETIIYSPTFSIKKKTALMRAISNVSFGLSSIISSLKVKHVDVVITTSPPPLVSIPGWMIARLKGAKLIYDVRDIWPDIALEMESFSSESLYCKTFRWIANFMYKHADIISTVSPGKVEKIRGYTSALMKTADKGKNTEKVWLVANGFDESIKKSEFNPAIVEKYELDKKFTCVYIGNIGLAQGLGKLLDIAAQTKHKNIQFLCFGMGAEKDILEKRVQDEGLVNVKFCNTIEHKLVFSILSKAKICFIPLKSSKLKDSIPTKMFEALGLGCPVFLLAEGNATEILEETKLGRYVSPDHTEELIEAFDDMVDHYDSFEAHKEEAIQLMQNKYSRQKIAIEFEKKIKSGINQQLF